MGRIYHTWHGYYPVTFANAKSYSLPGTTRVDWPGATADFGGVVPFSISFWAKTSATSGIPGPLQKINQFGIFYQFSGAGNVRPQIRLFSASSTSSYIGIRATSYEAVGTGWHHVGVSCDGSGTTAGFKMYINGAAVSATPVVSGSFVSVTSFFEIRVGTYFGNNWNGYIDEVALFSAELTASDFANIYNSGTPADIGSLTPVFWARFEDSLIDEVSGYVGMDPLGAGSYSSDVPT